MPNYAQFSPPARRDKTVLSASCLVCRRESDSCSERVALNTLTPPRRDSLQHSNVFRLLHISCRRQSSGVENPVRTADRGRHDTDRTVLSSLAWRCEYGSRRTLAVNYVRRQFPGWRPIGFALIAASHSNAAYCFSCRTLRVVCVYLVRAHR